jgi:hypothetical protein
MNPDRLTTEHVIAAFVLLDAAGIRRPDGMRSDKPEIAKALMLASAKVYALALPDLAPADLEAATMAVIRSASPFWPTPGQLLELVPRRRLEAVDDSGEAWAAVVRWCRANAFREPLPGDIEGDSLDRDEAIREGLRTIGGAKGFGRSTEAEEPFLARRFADAYKASRKRGHIGAEVLAIAATAGKRIGGSGFVGLLEGGALAFGKR